jgi:hypothetical protein
MIKFYGHSDDCAEVDGDIKDEIACYASDVRFRLGGPGGGAIITMGYGDGEGAVWWHRVAPIFDGIPVPWPIRFEREHHYSLGLIVDCPAGTPLTYATRTKGTAGDWGEEVPLGTERSSPR